MATKRLRLLSLMAVGVLAFGACSSTPSASGGGGADACAGTGTQGGANLQVPDVEQGKFNVAMVLIGPHDDGGWSQAHYEGLQYLCKNMAGSHVAYIENVPEGADSEQVFRSLSRKGFNFIIGTSFGYMDPMATVAEEFPDITYLHLTGYKSNGKNFGNFFGADRGLQVPRRHARRVAGQDGQATRRSATWRPSRSRRSSASATRSCAASRSPAPSARWTSGSSTPGTTRSKEKDGAASLFDAGADVVFTGADTGANADVAKDKGKWAVTYDHQASCHNDALPHRAVLDLGPGVRPDREAGPGQDLQGRLRVLRRRLEGDGPDGLHGGPDAAARASPSCPPRTSRRSRTRSPRCSPARSAGSTSSPAR